MHSYVISVSVNPLGPKMKLKLSLQSWTAQRSTSVLSQNINISKIKVFK